MDKSTVTEEVLERVKDTYTIKGTGQDNYINKLTSNAFDEFSILTGSEDIKAKYLFIIEGVVSKRYNRRGSEGLTSENVDGYSVNYQSNMYKELQGDFSEYLTLLEVEYNIKNSARKSAYIGIR